MSVQVPEAFHDLLQDPVVVILTTVSPTGKPYSAAVWRRWDGEHIRLVTDKDTRKYKNMAANPQVTVMTLDPRNPYRYLELGGEVVGFEAEGSLDELDGLTMAYMGKAHYYGDVEPAADVAQYDGVTVKIKPTRVVTFGG